MVEDQLPEYRERHYPPTLTLSMFLGQVMSADGSCQNAVSEHNVSGVGNGLPALSLETGGYCTARKRLPQGLVQTLVRETGRCLDANASESWLWKNRRVKTLTPQEASKNELGSLFADRWHVEVELRHLKTTLGMQALKCKTAEICEKELWVIF